MNAPCRRPFEADGVTEKDVWFCHDQHLHAQLAARIIEGLDL
ncbi:hypothetical protein [Komagataeibacter xylinus]|nr:hypothetical protein [Komagataeibacter xylinus]